MSWTSRCPMNQKRNKWVMQQRNKSHYNYRWGLEVKEITVITILFDQRVSKKKINTDLHTCSMIINIMWGSDNKKTMVKVLLINIHNIMILFQNMANYSFSIFVSDIIILLLRFWIGSFSWKLLLCNNYSNICCTN